MVPPCSDRVTRVPSYSIHFTHPFVYGAFTLFRRTFQTVPLNCVKLDGLIPVRSPLLGESRLISFPPGNEMFQFPGFASVPYIFRYRYRLSGGFPHSDIAGSKPVCRLPHAFRRLPRPSSPLTAKASTVCAYSLDHITPNRRQFGIASHHVSRLLLLHASTLLKSRLRSGERSTSFVKTLNYKNNFNLKITIQNFRSEL